MLSDSSSEREALQLESVLQMKTSGNRIETVTLQQTLLCFFFNIYFCDEVDDSTEDEGAQQRVPQSDVSNSYFVVYQITRISSLEDLFTESVMFDKSSNCVVLSFHNLKCCLFDKQFPSSTLVLSVMTFKSE